jgi:hypothetical protein
MRGNPRPIPASGHPLPNNPLVGTSPQGPGVEGLSNDGDGVFGNGKNGVHGRAGSNGVGVWGETSAAAMASKARLIAPSLLVRAALPGSGATIQAPAQA